MTPDDVRQEWLASEHEAIWLHSLVGARYPALTKRARASYAAHRTIRDRLLVTLRRAGIEPVTAALSYDVGTLGTQAKAIRAARRIESRIAAACLTLVGLTEGDERVEASRSVRRAALAELDWNGKPAAFPGLS